MSGCGSPKWTEECQLESHDEDYRAAKSFFTAILNAKVRRDLTRAARYMTGQ